MKSCYFLFVFVVAFCIVSVSANEALRIYPVLKAGAYEDFPFSSLLLRTTLDVVVGGPLSTHPCTEEPYFVRHEIRNSSPDDFNILSYDTPWESLYGDFFDIKARESDDYAKYIGPVASHMYPPKQEHIVHLPHRTTLSNGDFKVNYNVFFDLDISRTYEFPTSGIYTVRMDCPFYYYDDEKGYYTIRAWGIPKRVKTIYAEECVNSIIQVNDINDETQYNSCSEDQESKIKKAVEDARDIASKSINFIKEDSLKSKHLITDWFGKDATEKEYIDKIESVYEKINSFTPSVINCREGGEIMYDGWTFSDYESLRKFQILYLNDAEEEEEEEDEDEDEILPVVYKRIKDQSGVAKMELSCAPGMLAWLIPRDISNTVHICPDFFTLNSNDAAIALIDTFVRSDQVGSAINYMRGDPFISKFAATQPASIVTKNAGSYSIFAKKATQNTDEDIVIADV